MQPFCQIPFCRSSDTHSLDLFLSGVQSEDTQTVPSGSKRSSYLANNITVFTCMFSMSKEKEKLLCTTVLLFNDITGIPTLWLMGSWQWQMKNEKKKQQTSLRTFITSTHSVKVKEKVYSSSCHHYCYDWTSWLTKNRPLKHIHTLWPLLWPSVVRTPDIFPENVWK